MRSHMARVPVLARSTARQAPVDAGGIAVSAPELRPVPVAGLVAGRAGDPGEQVAAAPTGTRLTRLRRASIAVADDGREQQRHDGQGGQLHRVRALTSAVVVGAAGNGPGAAKSAPAQGRANPGDPAAEERVGAHEIAHVTGSPAAPGRQSVPAWDETATGVVRRYFPPPALGYGYAAQVTKTGGKWPNQPVLKQGWSIDKEKVPATEIDNNGGQTNGDKTTRLTALMTPGHAKLLAGNPTATGYDPIGWPWIVANEVRSARRQRISHWVRFHLLNATLGGKGKNIYHLIPADQSANGKWRTQIEAEMKLWVDKVPIWYDVQVTYYTQAEAPGTYAPGAGGIDYRPNIELFPKVIHADLKIFDTSLGQWLDRPSCTVRSGVPAAPGQRENELFGAQNLTALAAMYQIHADVLGMLSTATKPFTAYAQVRRRLEDWAAASTTASQYEARMDRIASSEPYLRSALTGTGNSKLKIWGAFVPDDQTPEAKFYVSPAHVKSGQDFHRFDSVTPAIRSGYHHARRNANDTPTAELFFHHYMRSGPIGNVTLGQLQTDWDAFVAANDALPPLVHTDLLPEGLEILTLVVGDFTRTVPGALHTQYLKLVGACRAVDSLRDQVAARIPPFVQHNLGTLRFTVYGSDAESLNAVRADPTVTGWTQEMDHRVQWRRHLTNKGLATQCPYDFLGAPITDPQPVRDAEAWYQQVKQQQPTVPTPTVPTQPWGQTTQAAFGGSGGASQFGNPGSQPFGQTIQVTPFGGFGASSPFGHPGNLQPVGQSVGQLDPQGQPGHADDPTRKSGGARYGSHSQRTGQGGHGRYPWGSNIHPKNRDVIRKIEEACERERSDGTVIEQRRIDNVLSEWRKPEYVGKGDTNADVKRALAYILKR